MNNLRTGSGDQGDTKVGNRSYRKTHSIIRYIASLVGAQATTTALPEIWGNFQPRELMQELLFQLEVSLNTKTPGESQMRIQELSTLMENQIEYVTTALQPLISDIRPNEVNAELMELRARLLEAEINCVSVSDIIVANAKNVNENLVLILAKSMTALNIAIDWVFSFIWVYSTNSDNVVPDVLLWQPWSEDKIRSINV